MNDLDNAILTFKVVLTVAPVAAYFLALGVVNSQACPRLISGRRDFAILAGAFLPALFWPLPALAASLGWPAVLAAVALGVLLARAMLPHPWKHWVVYNADAALTCRAVEQALRRLGWGFQRQPDAAFGVPHLRMRIEVAGLGLLNAVNLHIRTDERTASQAGVTALIEALDRSLRRCELLPTAAGLCLVLIGAVLMTLPMWLMTRHMSDIVEAIHQLFLA